MKGCIINPAKEFSSRERAYLTEIRIKADNVNGNHKNAIKRGDMMINQFNSDRRYKKDIKKWRNNMEFNNFHLSNLKS